MPEVDEAWDEFLEAYQKVKVRCDQLTTLILGFIEHAPARKKELYTQALKEILDGESISNS